MYDDVQMPHRHLWLLHARPRKYMASDFRGLDNEQHHPLLQRPLRLPNKFRKNKKANDIMHARLLCRRRHLKLVPPSLPKQRYRFQIFQLRNDVCILLHSLQRNGQRAQPKNESVHFTVI